MKSGPWIRKRKPVSEVYCSQSHSQRQWWTINGGKKKKKKKKTPVFSNKLIGKTHYTALLKSVCKWDIQLCRDIKAPLHISSLVLFCVLSVFKREWRRFKTAAIFQRIMLYLWPLPNDVSKPVYFSWKEVQRSANGESVSEFI